MSVQRHNDGQRDAATEALSSEDARVAKLQAELEDLHARLRNEESRCAEEIRQFAYAVSHDLREPLRMVASYTQLLERRHNADFDQDGREFLQFITDGVQRMDRLLSDLLAYSQLRPFDEPASPVSAESVLDGVRLALDGPIQESGAQITHDPLPSVMFDFGRLTQVLRQLIANSIKFRGPDPPRIHISATEADDHVTFAVRDNGVGIDPRYHQQIFGVFKRLHGREYPGTGIGLAISKRIVEQQGGTIWVESETAQGATFRFTLPQ